MKNNPDYGPWNVKPTEFVTSFLIVLLIHDLNKEKIEYEFEMDYGNPEDRKKLGRITFWALTNGRSVETVSKEDWPKIKEE